MTFDEWWEYEFEAPAFGLTIDDMRKAYKAGYEAGYEFGWGENDILSQTTAAANRGRG